MSLSQFRLGLWDEALTSCNAGIRALGDKVDDPPGFSVGLFLIPAVIHHLRADEPALEELRESIARIRSGQRAFALQLWLAVAEGRPDRALRMVQAPPAGWQVNAGFVWVARCDASWSGLPVDEAFTTAEAAADVGRRINSPATTAHALRLHGVCHWRAGSLEAARSDLEAAAAQFRSLGSRFEEARTALATARLLEDIGDARSATALHEHGRSVYRDLRVVHDPMLDVLPAPRPGPLA
jgi:hypothetical protein